MTYTTKRHSFLKDYQDIHLGNQAILFCTGPSILDYKEPKFLKTAIKVGVNKIYNHPISNELNYYFFGSHYHIDADHKKSVDKLSKDNKNMIMFSSTFTAKFGDGRETGLGNINFESALKINALPIEIGSPGSGPGLGWVKDIHMYPFFGGTIAFPAIQFLLYTGVKEIYLVGCDLGNSNRHFYNSKNSTLQNDHASSFYKNGWSTLNEFIKNNYKDVKIYSINPVGLKGMFEDVYTR